MHRESIAALLVVCAGCGLFDARKVSSMSDDPSNGDASTGDLGGGDPSPGDAANCSNTFPPLLDIAGVGLRYYFDDAAGAGAIAEDSDGLELFIEGTTGVPVFVEEPTGAGLSWLNTAGGSAGPCAALDDATYGVLDATQGLTIEVVPSLSGVRLERAVSCISDAMGSITPP